MAEFIKLPVGIDNFEKIRRDGFYYVDKTSLIEQLLNNWGEVNLFTRPRRFGKTLNMSMLKCFFEIGTDQSLFEGLYISKNKALCDAYMGKYPVISISLKGVNADSYENARSLLKRIVMEEAKMHRISLFGTASLNLFVSTLPLCVRYPAMKSVLQRLSMDAYSSL